GPGLLGEQRVDHHRVDAALLAEPALHIRVVAFEMQPDDAVLGAPVADVVPAEVLAGATPVEQAREPEPGMDAVLELGGRHAVPRVEGFGSAGHCLECGSSVYR